MRKDICNELLNFKEDEIILNKSELARRFNCSRNTIDKYLKTDISVQKARTVVTKLEDYKSIILDKVDNYGSTSQSVFNFIKKKGFDGKYGIVNRFIKKHKKDEHHKATIRFETAKGVQAQVDWKEKLSMKTRSGEILEINIFLIVLGYSRQKFIKLTMNRTQQTLFECLFYSFKFYGGVPKEILFDNMRTVVDRAKSNFKSVTINENFRFFSLDAGFKIVTCRPYRPQTKGKVEALAKLMSRLKVYNEEFNTFEDLEKIVDDLNVEINQEVSQATNEKPLDRFAKEKEYLNTLPSMDVLLSYFYFEKEYKVSKESMISFKGKKYSVPIRYMGKSLTVTESEAQVKIFFSYDLIASFQKSNSVLNYKKEHICEILKSDAFKYSDEEEINNYIDNNLKEMDMLIE